MSQMTKLYLHLLIPAVLLSSAAVAAFLLIGRVSKIDRLKQALVNSFQKIASDKRWVPATSCVILSGGLDSSIVAEVGRSILGLQAAITVIATESATDLPYSIASAQSAGLTHHLVKVTVEDLLEQDLPKVIKVLKSFDPMTLRNDIAIARALAEAASRGYTCAVTGDAADELLGGYSFTHRLDSKKWTENRRKMSKTMTFGSHPIGSHLGVWVASPYLDPEFIRAAMTLGKDDCIRPVPPEAACPTESTPCTSALPKASVSLGKMPLRLAFPDVTSCWRRKDPIEVGCGTTELSQPGWFDKLISDSEFAKEKSFVEAKHGVQLRDKEHLYYYRAFRSCFPNGEVPGKPRGGSDPCPACSYEMSSRIQTFCVTCGHYDPNLRSAKKTSIMPWL